jgi:hypothetical protein
MTYTTSDRDDPNINQPSAPGEQNKAYIVLSDDDLAKGYVRPVRREYIHDRCHTRTFMPVKCAETYARDPKFYSATWCCHCKDHLPVSEFRWVDDQTVLGS